MEDGDFLGTCSYKCSIVVVQIIHDEMVLRVSNLPGMPNLRESCAERNGEGAETVEVYSVNEHTCEERDEVCCNDF